MTEQEKNEPTRCICGGTPHVFGSQVDREWYVACPNQFTNCWSGPIRPIHAEAVYAWNLVMEKHYYGE